jgi:hypothetical protein
MDHTGRAHHARASRTPSAGGSNLAGRRHETYPAVIRDRQWRRELDEHHSAAVRELGRVVITRAGTSPLLARPLIWKSDVGEESPAWHALAMTDRFVVAASRSSSARRTRTGGPRPPWLLLQRRIGKRLPGGFGPNPTSQQG